MSAKSNKTEMTFDRILKRTVSLGSEPASSPAGRWKLFSVIAHESAHKKDAWSDIVELPTERGIRYRYDMKKKEFFTDEVSVKIDTQPFAHGAMRECFRMKKLSKFVDVTDWHLQFANVVAKKYFKDNDRQAYFDDVTLQMDAKFWSEEYNRAGPPKKIDIMQMMVVELPDREGKPLYHVESFIEGEYVKYNSNSGYVETCRSTPQAFSHFTFEASGHKCMVVDVQGVGDLYTDPQIHTYDGREYGSGNLDTKGMALFFNSHRCNVICEALGLSNFDLTRKERKRTSASVADGCTTIRSLGSWSISSSEYDTFEMDRVFSDSGIEDSLEKAVSKDTPDNRPNIEIRIKRTSGSFEVPNTPQKPWDTAELKRSHLYSSDNRRPSCVSGATRTAELAESREERPDTMEPATILGRVHFDLGVYHYMGRFEEDKSADNKSAIFHLSSAAQCGLNIAMFTLGCLHLNIYHDELRELELPDTDRSDSVGMKHMEQAARLGNLTAILTVAHAYHGGMYGVTPNWTKADKYFSKYVDNCNSSSDNATFEPPYQIQAILAEMYQIGGHGLDKDPLRSGEIYTEAAEGAMSAMKGRLANKWFMLAEEAWAECEE